jgi:hypothetical protein
MSPLRLQSRPELLVLALAAAMLFASCSRYEQKPIPIALPSGNPNAVEAFGATIAATAYDDPARAKEIFGFDILGAGVLPVQVVFDNRGSDPIEIVPSQTFLVDDKNQLWNILDRNMAYNRIEKKTEWGELAPGAGKGAFLGAAAGAIVGAAIGIVTGRNVGEALGKGAAVGGAGGAVIGGAKGLDNSDTRRSIRDDLRNRSLENKPIPPQALSHGVLYFPAEAVHARTLRLQVTDTRTGEVRTLDLRM